MDLPWQEDGTRLFGSDLARRQFMEVALGELERRRLPWAWVEGEGDARLVSALAAIAAAGLAYPGKQPAVGPSGWGVVIRRLNDLPSRFRWGPRGLDRHSGGSGKGVSRRVDI